MKYLDTDPEYQYCSTLLSCPCGQLRGWGVPQKKDTNFWGQWMLQDLGATYSHGYNIHGGMVIAHHVIFIDFDDSC